MSAAEAITQAEAAGVAVSLAGGDGPKCCSRRRVIISPGRCGRPSRGRWGFCPGFSSPAGGAGRRKPCWRKTADLSEDRPMPDPFDTDVLDHLKDRT